MRRASLAALITGFAFFGFGANAEDPVEPILTDDGLYTQEWFLDSFLDLGEDLDEAAAEGKRFAVMWELKGCPYCKETHFVNFADPAINQYVRENFVILQLNYLGSRLVTDFDGEELEERELRGKIRHSLSPPPCSSSRRAVRRSAARPVRPRRPRACPATSSPAISSRCFASSRRKAYEDQTFREYLQAAGSG